ncbi:WAT1-related protein [Tanacetum coccineum]|uniref:WAT1-related protein n=1 Tax=Tanacetum coccineum TaxID=301880 RepID=A0ABQ5CFG7_9ASTR
MIGDKSGMGQGFPSEKGRKSGLEELELHNSYSVKCPFKGRKAKADILRVHHDHVARIAKQWAILSLPRHSSSHGLEKANIKKIHSIGKIVGTLVTVGGAMIMTLVSRLTIGLPRTKVNHYRFMDTGSAEDDGLWVGLFDPSKKKKKVVIQDPADDVAEQLTEKTESLADSEIHSGEAFKGCILEMSVSVLPGPPYKRVGYIVIPARTYKSEPNSFTLEARALSYATVYEGASDTASMDMMIIVISTRYSTPNLVGQRPDGIAYVAAMQPDYFAPLAKLKYFYDLTILYRSEPNHLLHVNLVYHGLLLQN